MEFSTGGSPGYLINRLARLFADSLQKQIEPLGLSTGVFPVMLNLWEADGLSQKELVERVGIEQGTMANTLSRMERDGLIERRPDKHDARMKRTWLTPLGQSLHKPAKERAMSVNVAILEHMNEEEREQLLFLLRKAITAFENPNAPTSD